MTGNNILYRIQQGDKMAFEELFKAHYSQLCSYANSFVNDLAAAQDIVQDFLFHVWEIKDQLPTHIPVRAFLFKSVHNRCLNVIKHAKIEEKYADDFRGQTHEITYEQAFAEPNELHIKLRNGIDMLPPERKKVFIMHRYDEYSYKEIAETLEISVKTVENQIGKALQFLRKHMHNEVIMCIVALGIGVLKIYTIVIGVN